MLMEIITVNRIKYFFLLGFVLVSSLMLWGCGSDNYDTSKVVTSDSALVSAAQLKEWIDAGYVNSGGFDGQVVILDYGTADDAKTISNACRVSTNEIRATRLEGVAEAASLVAPGEQMDVVVQRLGIDKNTTIVFTTGGANYFPTRAYWTFRYWGFPKSQLKVLDGGNAAFTAAYPELMTYVTPEVEPSDFSVADWGGVRTDLRASLGEMLTDVVPEIGATTMTYDLRGGDYGYNGVDSTKATAGYYDNLEFGITDHRVVFEGHPAGGIALGAGLLFTPEGLYKDLSSLRELFTVSPGGFDPATINKISVYCTSGYGASRAFFVLDGLLDIPVQLYDGSFSQWGNMAPVVTDVDTINVAADGTVSWTVGADGIDDVTGAMLPDAASAWATTVWTNAKADAVLGPVFNAGDSLATPENARDYPIEKIEQLNYDLSAIELYGDDPSNPGANQVENEDASYKPVTVEAPGEFDGGFSAGC